ncbi:MAG: aminotransferase class V-fold PLP-dependent enzyme [Proteobacteria bacterium]|nr:aminotransferase class V-fold PLP-dependent enzyme [Pseudomonadota bacterium]
MSFEAALAQLGAGPLTEAGLRAQVWPLFSRVLGRSKREIYLANHSLGRPLDRAAADVAAAMDAWYRDLDGAWGPWLEARERQRALTAKLVGAPRADCIIPKTSAGQGLRAVLNALDVPLRVVSTEGEFDSLDFILRAYRERGRIALAQVAAGADGRFHVEDLIAALHAGKGAQLLVLSTVMFRTAQVMQGVPDLVRAAHAAGAMVLLDLYHHAGVLPVDLAALKADFAVGGSYKYLRGGSGACWLYVRPDHLERLRTLDTGWFAKKDVFAYRRPDPPQYGPGGDAWLESTPPVLAPCQALAGLEFTLAIGLERLRAYSLAQQAKLLELLAAQGVPAEGARADHGAFVTVQHAHAAELVAGLARRGVNGDARGDLLRLCPDILNTEEELARAAGALKDARAALA